MLVRSVGILSIAVLAGLMSGCQSADPTAEVKAQMEEIKKQQRGRIEAPPEFREYKTYAYSATLLRSPFQEPIVIVDTERAVTANAPDESVEPDITRIKEELEFFGLDSLTMVGTIQNEGETLFALISDGKGGIYRVEPGNYMGRNFGEVIAVKHGQIEIVEIVSDGQGGWVKRPRTLILKENG